ncbi:MAG: DUF1501 domain-containing protein [Bacteroidetes bacterium]|nr:DUF1501 domain-containing protein [Bacteroidota bacterium]
MKRRTFLKSALATSAAAPIMLGGMPVHASSPLKFLAQLPTTQSDDRILIIVQLFGGNDGINTIPPIDDPAYTALRPNIALDPTVVKSKSVKFGDAWFHPALGSGNKGGFTNMMSAGNLAVVLNVGYPYPNLSHFRSTDIWLSGMNDSNPNDRLDTGWVGRYLSSKYPNFPADLPADPLAIQFGGFSLTLQAQVGRMGIEVGSDPTKQQGVSSALDTLDPDATGTAYANEYAFVADIAARSDKYAQRVKDSYTAGKAMLKGSYATDGFSQQMANCAALIAGGLQTKVYVVSMGGFDTHVSQAIPGTTEAGLHASLLGTLADAVAQFMNDMVRLNLADRVVGLTVSEFGRRPSENGSFGTDHGAASVQFVFGTQVNSGIFGTAFDLSNLDEDGNMTYQNDFRSVYLDVLTDWYGMTLDDARTLLKGGRNLPDVDLLPPVKVIQSQSNAAKQPRMSELQFAITSNYPNPFSSQTTLVMDVPRDAYVSIEITNMAGQRVAEVSSQTFAAGTHTISASLDLPSGFYLVTARSPFGLASRMIECVR